MANLYYDGPLPLIKKGKYATCKAYIRTYDPDVLEQVDDIINSKAFEGQSVYLMADAHVGAAGPCGLSATIGNYINPLHIGVDIGCTVSGMILDKPVSEDKLIEFEHKVSQQVPMGFHLHENSKVKTDEFCKFITNEFNKYRQLWPEMLGDLPVRVSEDWINALLKRINNFDPGVFWKSLGTVGGGNHFLEYDLTKDKKKAAFFLHFGSRRFGLAVATYWKNISNNPLSKKERKEKEKELMEAFKAKYKAEGKNMKLFKEESTKYISKEFEKLKEGFMNGYLKGDNMKGYLQDMCFAQLYARYNHITVQKIITDILSKYGVRVVDTIFTTHNFVDLEDRTLRKSSIRARKGETVIIPFSMRDGVVIAEGLGNPEWGDSAPHGAGRVMSRKEADRRLELAEQLQEYLKLKEEYESDLDFSDEKLAILAKYEKDFGNLSDDEINDILKFSMSSFEKAMEGIVTTSVTKKTIDESPMAYKDTLEIEEVIFNNTVKEIERYYPAINWKDKEGMEKNN